MSTCGKLGYRFLGKSGLKVSDICLGTMTFGERENGPVQATEAEAHRILDRFAECGGNFIDTSDTYQQGRTEEILGRWLAKQKRENFVVATKVRFGWKSDNVNGTGLSRVRIIQAVEDSLRRLQTDYIDLYQIHCWDAAIPVEETLGALNDLVRQGKVRYLGGSNLTGWQLQKIMDVNKAKGWDAWVSLQPQWNLLARGIELEVVDVCQNEGLGVLPWSPLKGGMLTDKVCRDVDTLKEGSRVAWASQEPSARGSQSHATHQQFAKDEKYWRLLDDMKTIGAKYGKNISQVAIRWLLQQQTVASVIIGVKTLEQLEENMAASPDWCMSDDDMKLLDEDSKMDQIYPYEMVNRLNESRRRR